MNKQNKYLMENESESERLWIKTNFETTKQQLLECGILKLPQGARILDAGSGSGAVSHTICELLESHGKKATLILADGSSERLDYAKSKLVNKGNVSFEFVPTSLETIPLKSESVDFIFCRFVFEYLQNPKAVFDEFYRVAKRGAIVVVADLDHNCMNHYPLESKLELQLKELFDKIIDSKLWDPYAGRKLYSLFQQKDFSEIKIDVIAHHLFYGTMRSEDLFNWKAKLVQIKKLVAKGDITLSFDFEEMSQSFLKYLQSPNRFSYSPQILVKGIKK